MVHGYIHIFVCVIDIYCGVTEDKSHTPFWLGWQVDTDPVGSPTRVPTGSPHVCRLDPQGDQRDSWLPLEARNGIWRNKVTSLSKCNMYYHIWKNFSFHIFVFNIKFSDLLVDDESFELLYCTEKSSFVSTKDKKQKKQQNQIFCTRKMSRS